MWEWVPDAWKTLGEHSGPLEAIAALLFLAGIIFFPVRYWWSRRQAPPLFMLANPEALKPTEPLAPPANTIQMDLATFEAMQERALQTAKKQLAAAHGEERLRLEEKIEALNARLRDPEEALAQQQAIITDLEAQLTRRGNEIGGDDLTAAKAALEAGDFTAARALFETLAARTAPEVAANADAEYALGQIAEAEIRWHDAARHYAKAARLNPSFDTLHKAREFAWRAGDYPAAFRQGEALLAWAVSTGTAEQHAAALNEHGLTLNAQGRYPEAEKLCRQALEIDRAAIGEKHPDLASHLNNLAEVVGAQGRYAEAEVLYTEALEIIRTKVGKGDPSFSTHLNNLALAVEAQGRYPEAEGLYLQAGKIDRATIGEEHPSYAAHLANLASVVEAQGRYAEAEGLYRQSLAIGRATIGAGHPSYALRLNNLAGVVEAQGRYAEAEVLLRETLDIDRATIGDAHPNYAVRLNNLARVVATQGRYEEAEGLWDQALNLLRQTVGDGHPNTRTVAESFLTLITNHLPNSPHRAEIEALLAAGQGAPPAKS